MNTSSEISSSSGPYSDHLNTTIKDIHLHEYLIYSISLLFGFPVNSYVIWLIVTGTGNGVAAEFFTLNLSINDILLCMYALISLLRYALKIPLVMWVIFTGLVMTGRPLVQCLMCVERYVAVVHPVIFLKFRPLRYRVACSVIGWMVTFGACVVVYIAWRFYLIQFYFYYMLVQPMLFLFIQLFCLVAVLRALKQSGPGERKREKEENHMKRRAFYLILIITATMVIMHAPYILLWILNGFITGSNGIASTISFACYSVPGVVLPILFLQRVGKLPFKCSHLANA